MSEPDLNDRTQERLSRYRKEKLKVATRILSPSELPEYEKFIGLLDSDVEIFNPYRLIPNRIDKTKTFVLGNPHPTSLMSDEQIESAIEEVKTHPWDIFDVYKYPNGSQALRANFYWLECERQKSEKGNFLHFQPFEQTNGDEIAELFKKGYSTTLPMYFWIKGTEFLVFAVNNKLIKLSEPQVITDFVTGSHAKFIKHFGFKESPDGSLKIPYRELKSIFEQMTKSDPATKLIIKEGERIYKDALNLVPKYIDMTKDPRFEILGFWRWYFSKANSD